MASSLAVELLSKIAAQHPDVGVIIGLGAYILYEIRFGRLEDLQERQRVAQEQRMILGVTLYKIVRKDDDLDETEFRDLLWSDDKMFPDDLLHNEPSEPPVGGDD